MLLVYCQVVLESYTTSLNVFIVGNVADKTWTCNQVVKVKIGRYQGHGLLDYHALFQREKANDEDADNQDNSFKDKSKVKTIRS